MVDLRYRCFIPAARRRCRSRRERAEAAGGGIGSASTNAVMLWSSRPVSLGCRFAVAAPPTAFLWAPARNVQCPRHGETTVRRDRHRHPEHDGGCARTFGTAGGLEGGRRRARRRRAARPPSGRRAQARRRRGIRSRRAPPAPRPVDAAMAILSVHHWDAEPVARLSGGHRVRMSAAASPTACVTRRM